MSWPSPTLFPSLTTFPAFIPRTNIDGTSIVEITDEFVEPTGEWKGYTAIPIAQETALREQKHVNIRSFVPDLAAAQVTMLLMDRLTMFYLDGEPAQSWSAAKEYNPDEVVEILGIKYLSLKKGTNKEPPNAEYWKVTSSGGELGRYSHDSIPSAKVVVVNNESWTFGTVGPQSDRNNWNGIKVECAANQTTTTQSVITTQS